MILGNGMLANYFREIDKKDVIFFCSGVSDSLNFEFSKEEKILSSLSKNKLLVYTSSITSKECFSAYDKHKIKMESLVEKEFRNYLIFKVGNLVGSNQNKNQFLPNIFHQAINKKIKVANCKRDLLLACDYIKIVEKFTKEKVLGKFCLCSYSPPTVEKIIDEIEKHIGYTCLKENIDEKYKPKEFKPDVITGDDGYYKIAIKWYFENVFKGIK